MTVVAAHATTVFYCIPCGRRKDNAAVRVMTQQHRRKPTQQQRRQNNKIAEAITHKSNQYNK